jgi:hypothetical protein
MGNSRVLLIVIPLLSAVAGAQTVVSVTSGVINYSEGSVFVDNNKLDQKSGTFPTLVNGAVLKTEHGRVEVLLTPGAVLRLDHNSSIRLVSNALSDTKVEFQAGAAILDATEADSLKNLKIEFGPSEIRFDQPGVYRIDGEPAAMETYSGKAEITKETKTVPVDPSHVYFLDAELDTPKSDGAAQDEFYQWAHDRSETVLADNRLADQIKDSGSDPNADTDNDSDDDDTSSLLLPGAGAGLPSYPGPAPDPSLIGPLPNQNPSAGYSPYPSYPYTPINPYPTLGAYSSLGITAFPLIPVYVVPRGYNHAGGFSTAAAEAQYWRLRLQQLQAMQNRMWQYRATHLPPSSLGLGHTYTSSFASPTHSYVPRPAPHPLTPVVPHPSIAHPAVGVHAIGHR